MYCFYQLLFAAHFTVNSYIVVVVLMAVICFFGVFMLMKSHSLVNDANDSNMRAVGKIFSIMLILLTTLLTLPIMRTLVGVYVCSVFQENSKHECNSTIRYVLVALSSLFMLALLFIHALYFLFDQYKGINYLCPWKDRTVIAPILKLVKKILLVVAQCIITSKIIGTVMMAFCCLVDVVLIGNLILFEYYYYTNIQYIELFGQVIIIWWDAGVLFSLVARLIRYLISLSVS